MNPNDFDEITKAWARLSSRRNLLLGLGSGVFAGVAAVGRREGVVSGKTETITGGTPEPGLAFNTLLPSLDPIPIGADNYLVNGQTVFLDPEVAASLQGTPTIQLAIGDEPVYINLDVIAFPSVATPEFALATPGATFTEAPCGLDNSQDVELYRGDLGVPKEFVAGHQPSVGNLRWNSDFELSQRYKDTGTVGSWRWCSGTLLSNNLFLTAGHCFEQRPLNGHRVPRIVGTDDPIPRAEIATNMHVDFGYQLDSQGRDQLGTSFPIVELVEDRLGDLDYAIVRLGGTPGLTLGSAKIAGTDAPVGDTICIIGHPLGTPKRIEAGPVTRLEGPRILYNDVDTNYGSSGSGILAHPDGPVVGVHTTGGCGPDGGANSGIRISALLLASPMLRSLPR